mmetsp:Transcript_28857/g.95983  ORF Transcript_28857/g.95983 Transcript_28857/m.95983 type:complete len:210 (+) Transcript_28857:1572-2201(+)
MLPGSRIQSSMPCLVNDTMVSHETCWEVRAMMGTVEVLDSGSRKRWSASRPAVCEVKSRRMTSGTISSLDVSWSLHSWNELQRTTCIEGKLLIMRASARCVRELLSTEIIRPSRQFSSKVGMPLLVPLLALLPHTSARPGDDAMSHPSFAPGPAVVPALPLSPMKSPWGRYGNTIWNFAPLPTSLSTVRLPPCLTAISLEMDSPRPKPS